LTTERRRRISTDGSGSARSGRPGRICPPEPGRERRRTGRPGDGARPSLVCDPVTGRLGRGGGDARTDAPDPRTKKTETGRPGLHPPPIISIHVEIFQLFRSQ
jgi:hypothetical protein